VKKRLLIIDGSQMVYAAHHAMANLKTKDGHPSGVVYGCYNTLIQLKAQYTHMAFVLDRHRHKTFRHELFPEYKAGRSDAPEEIGLQIKDLKKLVKAMGIPLLIPPKKYEADDMIGSIAYKNRKRNTTVRSRDKDFMYLLQYGIHIHTGKKFVTPQFVFEKFGVRDPKQVFDWLCICGDLIDGIPGVKGWGPKTTVKYLNGGGTVASLLKDKKLLKPSQRNQLRMSRKLVKIVLNLETPTFKELSAGRGDPEALKKILERYSIKPAMQLKSLFR